MQLRIKSRVSAAAARRLTCKINHDFPRLNGGMQYENLGQLVGGLRRGDGVVRG